MDPVSKAQLGGNTDNRARSLANLRPPWQPGQSGNISGRPRKLRITKMFENVLRNAQNRKDIEAAILKILLRGGMAPVLLLREMAERTEGKVVQPVEIDAELTISLADAIQKRRQLDE